MGHCDTSADWPTSRRRHLRPVVEDALRRPDRQAVTTFTGPDPDDPWAEWTWVLRVPERVAGLLDQAPEVA